MLFDPDNAVNKLCAEGMEMEGKGELTASLQLFTRAWDLAGNDAEKFIAAHYLARRQEDIAGKLYWDTIALTHAQKVTDTSVKGALPSLHLNIGKCYEDLGKYDLASEHYTQALAYANELGNDGYGSMIRKGIKKGIERIKDATL
ncbi:MAG: tetratricopeptide repeat protein [Bacteroidetes bacterium]|nr:tetratricopeptide repeat protein [Bacteroidota bacterium]